MGRRRALLPRTTIEVEGRGAHGVRVCAIIDTAAERTTIPWKAARIIGMWDRRTASTYTIERRMRVVTFLAAVHVGNHPVVVTRVQSGKGVVEAVLGMDVLQALGLVRLRGARASHHVHQGHRHPTISFYRPRVAPRRAVP